MLRTSQSPRVAVVGAGIAGLACARTLDDHGIAVEVFERGESVGGRIGAHELGAPLFDAGAQYFTARDPRFARDVDAWIELGHVAEWKGRVVRLRDSGEVGPGKTSRRFVGVPTMASVAGHLARDVTVHVGCGVSRIERDSGRWVVFGATQRLGSFDTVVVAAPPRVVVRLLDEVSASVASAAGTVEVSPCWAAILELDRAVDVDFDAAFVDSGALRWIARNNSKPGRGDEECWVLHASSDFSMLHLEQPPQRVLSRLEDAFWSLLPAARRRERVAAKAVLWPSALPEPLAASCLYDASSNVGACGDWCGGPRVEGAFLSGVTMARHILTAAGVFTK